MSSKCVYKILKGRLERLFLFFRRLIDSGIQGSALEESKSREELALVSVRIPSPLYNMEK